MSQQQELLSRADRLIYASGFDPKTMRPLGSKSRSVFALSTPMGNGSR